MTTTSQMVKIWNGGYQQPAPQSQLMLAKTNVIACSKDTKMSKIPRINSKQFSNLLSERLGDESIEFEQEDSLSGPNNYDLESRWDS